MVSLQTFGEYNNIGLPSTSWSAVRRGQATVAVDEKELGDTNSVLIITSGQIH
jgi:hypothetical protein